MAIARIKKIRILAHKAIKEELVSALQKAGAVEITSALGSDPFLNKGLTPQDSTLQSLSSAIEFTSAFEPKKGALESLMKVRPLVKEEELARVAATFDYKTACDEAGKINARLKEIHAELARLASEFSQLKPWLTLDLPIEQIRQTQAVACHIGTMPLRDYEGIAAEAVEKRVSLYLEEVAKDAGSSFLFAVYHKSDEEKTLSFLRGRNFSFVFFPGVIGKPRDVLNNIQSSIGALYKERKELEGRIGWLLRDKYKLMAVHDFYFNEQRRREIEQEFFKTDAAILIEGWTPLREVDGLTRALAGKFKDIHLEVSDPAAGESIPTILENKKAVEPFETVVNLYGQPLYKAMDPTPYLAPFFALFFGVCLTDAGYGVVLLLLSWILLKKLKLGPAGGKLMKLFIIGSAGTVFAGAVTGGWFGDIIDRAGFLSFLRPAKNAVMLFDPLKDPLKFLTICLGLGFIHISFGVLLKCIRDWTLKDYKTLLFLDIPTFAIQSGLLGLILGFIGVLPKPALGWLWGVLGISAALVIIYQWLVNEGIGMRLFWSVFGLYGIVAGNFLADTLSYSRLFALGLATGLMAMAINEISMLIFNVPFIGFLLGAVVFVGAHLFNIAINVLGAYVHTSRLQYLEFFGKFFESGGRPFRPFIVEGKYTVIGR